MRIHSRIRERSLVWYVAALSAAISVPLCLLCLMLSTDWVQSERARLQAGTRGLTDYALSQIDRYLASRVAMLQALATSPAFDQRDFGRIDAQARELLDLQGSNIVVREPGGQQRVNTRLPWGAPLPKAQNADADREVLQTKGPYVTDLAMGLVAAGPLVRVLVPVLRGGQVVFTITASLPPKALETLLQTSGIKPPFSASLADRQGAILARTADTDLYVGKTLPGFAVALGERGDWSGTNPQGVPVFATYRRSRSSGWLVSVGVERAALNAPLYRSLWLAALVTVALGLTALLATLDIARRLLASQRQLIEAARSLELGDVVPIPQTPLREANLIGEALVDASARLRAQASALARSNHELEARVEKRTRLLRAQAELLRVTLDNMDQGLIMIDGAGTVPVANRRALQLLDLPGELMAARPSFKAVLDYQLQRNEFSASGEPVRRWVERGGLEAVQHDYERQRPNGTILEIRTVPLANGGAVRTYTDITERRRRESELRHAEAEYRGLFENATIGIYRSTLDGRLLRANPALVRLNGHANEEALLAATHDIGREWYVDPARRDGFLKVMRENGGVTEFESEVYRHATRERIWVSETAWTVYGADGAVLWFEGTVVEATDRKRAEAEIRHIANHDGLTGLPNRKAFGGRLEELCARHGGPADGFALLCLDLDRFKTVNDTLGHQTGDALLRQVAGRITDALGCEDMAARLGGDEFAVIQLGSDQPEDAEMLARHLIDALALPFDLDGRLVNVGVSIGIATPGERTATADRLFADADFALYRAKTAGRNTYSVFETGMDAQQQARRSLELDLRGAVDRSELFLEFQPSIDIVTTTTTGFEALLRWAHPVRGLCSPAAFIPLAEETGLIVGIGDWVLKTACTQAAAWPRGVGISVNMSAVQFASGDVVRSVVEALAVSRLAPERLEIEITESVLLHDREAVARALDTLRSFGVRIALDDFGTGFSSLGYLRQFRFDKIKIDRSFVADIADPDSLDIIRAIVGLGRRRRIAITAEGVETKEQFDLVAAEGCTQVQGFLVSRPLAAERVVPFIEGFDAAVLAA